MTTLNQQIQNCFDNNNTWHRELTDALYLHTLGVTPELGWVAEWLTENGNNDYDAAEAAVTEWIETNAVDNLFTDVPAYGILFDMDEDERNQLILDHAANKGCAYKGWVYLLTEFTDWLYEQEIWTAEKTLEIANEQLILAKADDNADELDAAMIEEFIEQFTADQAA